VGSPLDYPQRVNFHSPAMKNPTPGFVIPKD